MDTRKYLWDGAYQGQGVPEEGQRDAIYSSSPAASHKNLDSVALGRAVATLLVRSRCGAGLFGVGNGGDGAAGGDHGAAGLGAATEGRQWCDIVVVHGCEALDIEFLPPGKLGLAPAEAVSVFVDLVPQVRWSEFGLGQAADVSGLYPADPMGTAFHPGFWLRDGRFFRHR